MRNTVTAIFMSILACLLLISLPVFTQADSLTFESDSVTTSYQEIYEALSDLNLDITESAKITNFKFQRDVANFHLRKGEIYLCTPVQGRISAAVFLGRGNFSFTPPTEIEQDHLARFYKKTSYSKDFNMLFLFFVDSTLAEFRNHLDFQPGKSNKDVENELDYALNYLHVRKAKFFDYSITKTFLESAENGYFYAHFSKRQTDPMFFEVNPHSEEEVRFMRRSKNHTVSYVTETINQFHAQAEYRDGEHPPNDEKLDLDIHKYTIDASLSGYSLDLTASCRIDFESLYPEQKWLAFVLYSELIVDSVFWENGNEATFVKDKDNHVLWIKADHPLAKNEQRSLTIYYHGELIERQRDWFFIRSSVWWYPVHGERDRSDFDIVYHIPDKFQFASAGTLTSSDTSAGTIHSRWVSPRPLRNFSFNIGFFKEHEIDSDSLPPITIYMADTGHDEIAHALAAQGLGSGKDMEIQVGKDIRESAKLFQEMFGPIELDHFYATEIPFGGHGEAFPGLIHLPWITFHRTNADGSDEIFRAHEVAHQWWGIGVDFQTYHDQWISEGFAEYAGMRYYQEVVRREEKDEKKFYKMLERRRKEIINNRKFLLGDGQKAAPIWLGRRTYSSDTEEDYRIVIYRKGAWVLHMLRSMTMDLSTGNDSIFSDLLKGFYQAHYNRRASTEDFLEFSEKKLGMEMDWFFEQWIYDSDIPTYRFAHKIVEEGPSQFKVFCRVRQQDVDSTFRMPVSVGVQFKDKSETASRHLISGEISEFELGPFQKKPKKVIFNYRESVLCKVKKDKWK